MRDWRSSDANIVLIGMPGVGKSTAGVLLAKRLSRDFVDTDIYLQRRCGCSLQDLLSSEGVAGFCAVEEREVLSLSCRATVIATGGSVVYGARAMAHLARSGVIVYLRLGLSELETRLTGIDTRGVVRPPGCSLAELFAERTPLYERYAEITVDCEGLGHYAVVSAIIDSLASG